MKKLRKKTKKIILLDIDGVIAPFYSTTEKTVLINMEWATLSIPIRIIKFLKQIPKDVTIIWCSIWQEYSYIVSNKLNLRIKKHIVFDDSNSLWIKSTPLKQFISKNKHHEILLIDDEANLTDFSKFNNLTTIIPDSDDGLSNEDMNKINEWIIK